MGMGLFFKRGFFSGGRGLFVLLCLITFLTAITTGNNVFSNAVLVSVYELLFVVGFFVDRFRGKNRGRVVFEKKTIGAWLLIAWFICVTFSLINSPYGLMMEWFAVKRYYQSLFHVIFFLCLLDFLPRYKQTLSPLMLSISVSVVVLAFVYIGAWQSVDSAQELGRYFWFRLPPLNAHIRIVGFLVASAVAVVSTFFVYETAEKRYQGLLWAGALVIWGFLYWTGGRGAILSAWIACLSLLGVLLVKKQPVRRYVIAMVLLSVCGVVLAELFEVFFWNGVIQAASRTAEAGGDIYKLSTGRTKMWGWVLESINSTGSYAFGLGPQGYCYMPNRTFAFDPHNLFFQFLAEWGVVGAILFLSLLGVGFVRGVKNHILGVIERLSVPALAAGAIILALGAHSLVDGVFYHAQSSFYMAISFAVWMTPSRE